MTLQQQVFNGKIKYSGLNKGSICWKSGHLAFSKDDYGWKMDFVLAVTQNGRPALTIKINKNSVRKCSCNTKQVYLDLKLDDKSSIMVTYASDWQGESKKIKELVDAILRDGTEEVACKAEVSKMSVETSPKFTSVKEVKRDRYNDEGKENYGIPNKSQEFLQRGIEKASWLNTSVTSSQRFYGKPSGNTPKPLWSSTPNKQTLGSVKRPGLMPDPTPNKKARLSGLAPNYSMKTKLFSTDENKTQDKSQSQQQTLQGFSNLGNTCYMNAILQSLFGLDTFATDLVCNRRVLRYLSNQSLYNAMCRLLYTKRHQTSTDMSKRESLRRVKSAISNSAKRFSGYGQHDAHEFLGQVLDQLKEEIVKISKSTPSPSREGEMKQENLYNATPNINPVSDNFEFEILHTISCEKCSHQLTKSEQFHDISADVPKRKDLMTPRSLQDALTLFFRQEKFEYKCENCGHDKSDVSHKIKRLPRVLIIHLKRYTYNQMFSKNTKMGQNVTIPMYLTLQKHCTEDTQPAFPPNFNTSGSDSKSLLDDSHDEDVPSRRKLDYKSPTHNKSDGETGDHTYFTETKEKKDEDPDIARAIEMSLQDIEEKERKDTSDDDMARAIELSLQEQQKENQMQTDFGDDSDADLEKAIEMSRQDFNYDNWNMNVEDKENKDPTLESNSGQHEANGEQSDMDIDEVDGHTEATIDLTEMKNDKGELPYSYRLVSIVNHMGISSITGHYLSDVYDMKKRCWYSYDDTHVNKLSESDVLSKRERSGYIFFYMNKDTFDDLMLNNEVNASRTST